MRELLMTNQSSDGMWRELSDTVTRQNVFVMRFLAEQSSRLYVDSPLQADWQTIVAVLVTIVGSALATSAGIGGGALFVPMFHVLVGFGLRTSTALSQTIITGGSLASVMVNAFKSNPADPSRALIDYRLVLVFTPVLLLGVNTGVLMNSMFPEWLITIFLVSLIVYLVASSCKKGRQLWRMEHEYTLIAAAHPEHHPMAVAIEQQYKELPEEEGDTPVRRRMSEDSEVVAQRTAGPSVRGGRMQPAAAGDITRGGPRPQRQSLECQLPQAPRGWRMPLWLNRSAVQTAELLLLWGGFSAVQVVKTRTELCSRGFWYLYSGQVLLMLCASVAATWQGMKLQQRQQAHPGHMVVVMDGVRRVASQPAGGVLQFTWKMMIICQVVTLLAGITGGLLGIGGGMVMSPLLLQMGVEPQVSAATTSLMVLFSSSTAVVQFAIMGRLNVQYSLLFSAVSLVASLAGVLVVGSYVKRSGRTSVIVLILAFVVSVGGLVTGAIGIKQAVHDFSNGTGIGFNQLCPS